MFQPTFLPGDMNNMLLKGFIILDMFCGFQLTVDTSLHRDATSGGTNSIVTGRGSATNGKLSIVV